MIATRNQVWSANWDFAISNNNFTNKYMIHFVKAIHKKIDGLIWSFLSTGIILVMLSILIVWTDFMLRLVIGLLVLVIAYAFLYTGFRLMALKKEIDKYLKM